VARVNSNENVSLRIVEALRKLGHDIETSFEAGNANQETPDEEVLEYALSNSRVVLTNNRKDFIKLHRKSVPHCGIAVYTVQPDAIETSTKIHGVLSDSRSVGRFLARVHGIGFEFDL